MAVLLIRITFARYVPNVECMDRPVLKSFGVVNRRQLVPLKDVLRTVVFLEASYWENRYYSNRDL